MIGEFIIERLPLHCALHNLDNPMRNVFISTVGSLLDDFDVSESREGVYLESAVDEYLDAQGKDYGVSRKLGESDDDYRTRLVYESLGYLTVNYLLNVYDLPLYTFTENFTFSGNTLTSDNPFIPTSNYMSIADEGVKQILAGKFLVDGGLFWITGDGFTDYILVDGVNVIQKYLRIYGLGNLKSYFWSNTDLEGVKLSLPSVVNCEHLFYNCTGLTSVELDLPSATDCRYLLADCTGLESIVLSIPKNTQAASIFRNCSSLESIDLTVPADRVNNFKSYVLGLGLSNLTSFILNGEEVPLE